MKRKIEHPAPSARELAGPRYWRSLDELAGTPGFKDQLAREFPEGASTIEGVDRRQFVKIMAASFALGGVGLAAGCRRPEANILPFGKSIEGAIPGLPLYYATSMPLRRTAIPLLAETHQGRPTKLEGNPGFALLGGVSSLAAQSSLLDLYDPDRATAHTEGGAALDDAAVKDRLAAIGRAHAGDGGSGLAFLAGSSASPTRARLLAKLKTRFPKAVWAEYEPVADEPPLSAAQAVFGSDVRPIYRFSKATRIVSLDCDFLSAEAGSLYYARDFARGRRVTSRDDPMNRLYAVESNLTLTGSMADHRLRLASGSMLAFAGALAARITGDPSFAGLGRGLDVKPEWISECASDLGAAKGESLVIAGAHLPPEVHAVAYAINAALGNLGSTIDFVDAAPSGAATLSDLAAAIRAGSVRTLVILEGNPAYNAPADLDWPSLQKSVAEVVRFGYYVDETSELAGVHLAAAHYLESWGDSRALDGTILPIQPMILPLFGGLTEIEVLARIAGEAEADPYKLVYETVTADSGAQAEAVFRRFLHDGLLANSEYPALAVQIDSAGLSRLMGGAAAPPARSRTNLEVRFVADHKLDDGRFANNGWLQECPDPITKLAWDNAILVSPRLAKDLGIDPQSSLLQIARKDEQSFEKGVDHAYIAELTVGGRKVRAPLHIQVGLSNYTVVVPLGYGRRTTGRIGRGIGFNAYDVRTAAAPHIASGTLELTGERRIMADTQWHWSMEGREIIREANYSEYQENPAFVKEIGMEAETPVYGAAGDQMTLAERVTEVPRGNSLYVDPKFDGVHQWGMSIDLNTCTGCNACVVACQAENNIPIVGRDQAIRGRSMHWIRIDRYYSDGRADAAAFGGEGNLELPEDPQISLQPVACMQCELAPCEMVCPVNATAHDSEGLNVMAYNRCVGTRYCANNCPYKVRRFNYFDWNQREIDSFYMGPLGPKGMPELVKMAKNPEVTVRMRGVMEKCTYCVQRIENGKIQWKVKMTQAGAPGDVVVPDGIIKTACQQACPVDAIVFGNLLDEHSAVSKAKSRAQDYELLGYLNTRPRTTYLGRLRNPNPSMPDYQKLPLSRVENFRKNHPAGFVEPGEGGADAAGKQEGHS
jgi:molybdopterin-containing oxidoreductase family iron-sulfur binding subunit